MIDMEDIDESMRFMLARALVRDLGVNHIEARNMVNHWQDEVRAKAWDEGHDAGWASRHEDALIAWVPSDPLESDARNPYRQEKDA